MAFVITGATGHVGNNLVRFLVEKNLPVRVIVRKTDRSIEKLNIEYIVGDVFDKNFLNAHINSEDVVIHTAAFIDVKNNARQECLKVNYDYAKLITDICIEKKVKKYIFFSSVDAIYKENMEIVTEPDRIYPEKLTSNYAHSKALATNYILKLMKINSNLDISIIYPTAVIGINDYKPSAIGKLLLDIVRNKTQFGIAGGYDFIDVSDLVRATVNLATSDKHGSYIISGNKATIIELYSQANICLKKRKLTYHIPLFFVKLCIPFVPYLSRFVLEIIVSNYNYENSKAKKELGLEVTPFNQTINHTLKWFKNYYQEGSIKR